MQSNRVLGIGLLLLIAAAAAFAVWQFGLGGTQGAMSPLTSANAGQEKVAPAVGVVDENGNSGARAPAPATADGVAERVAAPASAAFDESKPAIVGRVVDPEGRPIAGAKVVTAPGMSFANANGRMDFDTFDFADFEDLDMGDMSKMTSMLREQLADRFEVTTDVDGRFRAPARGTSRAVGLRVLARGYSLLDRRVERPSERDQDVGTLVLQQSAIVSGRVLEAGGAPIAGAQVGRVHEMETRFMGGVDIDMPEMAEIEALRGGETAITDANGRFELPHLAPGDLVLRARHPDHPVARTESMPLEAGHERRDVLITMQRGGEIRGVVLGLPADAKGLQVMASKVQRPDANPAAGMFGAFGDVSEMLADMGMSFGERNADIGADGKFLLRGLARDSYRVWVGRKGPGFAGSSAYSAKVEAMPGGVIELRYEPGVSVTFTVVDGKSGAPIERLWVRDRLRGGDGFSDMMAMGMPRQVRAAQYPGGAVTVANLRPKGKQKLTLTIDATGYDSFERTDIELPKSGSLDLGRLELAPMPTLQVAVVTADGGRPIAGATVRIETASEGGPMRRFAGLANLAGQNSGPRSGKSDSEGRCTLNRPSAGEAKVAVDVKGFAPFASETITFTAGGPATYAAKLFVGGTVAVTVADIADKPVKDAAVEHKAPDGETSTRKADAQGLARFEHLAPGTHSFRLAKDAGPMAMFMAARGGAASDDTPWQTFEVTDRASGALKLVKQPTAALRGIVRENGLPLAGARVSFREGTQENEADAATDAMGEMMGAIGGGASKRNAKTDDQGLYALAELPEGQHRLSVTHKGRAVPAKFVLALKNGDNTFDIELDMTTVRGVVADPEGKPLEGARVRVRKVAPADDPAADLPQGIGDAMESVMPGMNLGGSTIKTDANGAFELRGVEPDVELVVQASAKGFAPASGKVTAARGSTKEMARLQVVAAGKVKVTVADAGPFGGLMATYVGEGDKLPPVMAMLRRGKGTLDGLRPGRWEISMPDMQRGGNANAGTQNAERKKIVEVVAGETIEVDL